MKHPDLKVWKFCPTSSCLSSQDPLFGEKLVLCVATSATILPKTMLWKCDFQNCKKKFVVWLSTIAHLISVPVLPANCPFPSLLYKVGVSEKHCPSNAPRACPHFTRFSGQRRNSKLWAKRVSRPKIPSWQFCDVGLQTIFGFSPVCANSDKCCRNGVRYIFLILSFICSILSFVGTRLLGEGWTLQQVQLKQFVL